MAGSKMTKSKGKGKINGSSPDPDRKTCWAPHLDMMLPLIAEFLASLIFVFFQTILIIQNNIWLLVSAYFAPVFIAYRISGARINPVISLMEMLLRRLSVIQGFLYIVVQLIGGIAGAAIAKGLVTELVYSSTNGGTPSLGPDTSLVQGLMIETVFTFILVLAYLMGVVDPDEKLKRPAFPGLAVGVYTTVGSIFTGPSVNPAFAFGSAMIYLTESSSWEVSWLYFVGPLIGMLVALVLYRYLLIRPDRHTMKLMHK